MAGRSRVEIDPRFRRLMQRLPDAMTAPVTRAIAESAEQVAAAAQKLVPRDTGELAESIGVRVTSTSADVGFDPKKFRRLWKKAGWRAKFTEFGTKGYEPGAVRKAGGTSSHIIRRRIPARPAKPFLRPAFAMNQKWIMDRHRKAVAETLRRAESI